MKYTQPGMGTMATRRSATARFTRRIDDLVWMRLLMRNIAIVAPLLVMASRASKLKITHHAMASLGAIRNASTPLEFTDAPILQY